MGKEKRDVIFLKKAFMRMSILVVLFYTVSLFVPNLTALFIFIPYIALVVFVLGIYGTALVIELVIELKERIGRRK